MMTGSEIASMFQEATEPDGVMTAANFTVCIRKAEDLATADNVRLMAEAVVTYKECLAENERLRMENDSLRLAVEADRARIKECCERRIAWHVKMCDGNPDEKNVEHHESIINAMTDVIINYLNP